MVNVHTISPSIIVPAAGLSSRMATWKPGLALNGEALLVRALRLACRVSDDVILVTGYRHPEAELIGRRFPGVRIHYNPWYRLGLFSSLRVGAQAVKRYAAYVLLPDMPLITPHHFALLPRGGEIEASRPTYGEKPGHPVFLSQRVLKRAASFAPTGTMQQVIDLYRVRIVVVNDPATVVDIDTVVDYKRLIDQASRL